MSNYSSNFPTQRPSLNLVFNGGSDQLDSRISYTRSSTGTYLSNEKALNSENLLLQSQDFDTSWSRIHLVSSVSGGHSAPDGSSTGWLMTANTGTSQEPQLQQLFTVNSNTEYTAIAHLKAGTASHGYVSFRGGSGGHYAYAIIDFSAGTVADGGSGFTGISSSITALSDSWYKVTVTATSDSTTSSPYCFIGISDGSAFGSNGTAPYDSNGETMYAWGAQLSSTNSKVYDSPTTAQISREYSPLLKTASADAPRFEFDASGNAKGLLIEAQATNLQRYGSDFASWNNFPNVTVTSNAAVAPNGLLEADLVVASSTPASTYVYDNSTSIVSGTTYTASLYIKSAGQRYVQLLGGSGSFHSDRFATYDLQTGSVDANGVTASAESVGNGWWRIEMSILATGTSSAGIAITFVDSATSSYLPTFTGNDFDGLLIWGFQLETGSSTSSLVDTGTSSSSATRAADSCSLVSAPLLDNGSGGLTVEYDMSNASTTSYVLQTSRSTGGTTQDGATIFNEGLFILGQGSNTRIGSTTSNVFHKVAASWESGSQKISRDGSAVAEDTTTVVPHSGTDKLHIGTRQDGNAAINGHIRSIAIYSEPLTSTNLTTLSQL